MLVAVPATAQVRDSMVAVPASLLTADQKAQMEVAATQAKIQTYGKWVGLGKEVGEAVNSSLAAVTDQTARFADTKVGKVTMALVI
jgi:muconolactone delta-isomerase